MKFNLFIILILFSEAAVPQTGRVILNDISTFLETGENILTAPAHFDKSDIMNLSGAVLLTAGSFLLDNEGKSVARLNRNDFNKHFYYIDRYYYIEFSSALTAGTYLYGLLAENKNIRQLGIDLGEAAFYSGTLNILVKLISGRSRPYETNDNTQFDPFNRPPRHSAFGSAHTTLAFAVSTVMSHQLDNIFWKGAWYTAAGLVGLARIYHNMHWFSDVVFGAVAGYFIGSFVIDEKDDTQLVLAPGILALRINL